MSLLRIDCPDCGSKYARHQEDFLFANGHWVSLSCVDCDRVVHETGRAWRKETDDYLDPDKSRAVAHRAVLKAYLLPMGRMKVVAREGESA